MSALSPEDRRLLAATGTDFAGSLQQASAAIAAFAMESREIADARRPGVTPERQLGEAAIQRAMLGGHQRQFMAQHEARRGDATPRRWADALLDAEMRIDWLSRLANRPEEREQAGRVIQLIAQSQACRQRAAHACIQFEALARDLRSKCKRKPAGTSTAAAHAKVIEQP